MKTFGIILIVIGIAMVFFTNINFQTKEKVADLGPVEINKTEDHQVGWPTYAGGIVAAVGLGLVLAGGKKKNS